MSEDWDKALKNKCRQERRFQDSKIHQLNLTKEILASNDSDDIKIMRLCTECGFGYEGAQQKVFGVVRFRKKPKEFNPVNKDFSQYYKREV